MEQSPTGLLIRTSLDSPRNNTKESYLIEEIDLMPDWKMTYQKLSDEALIKLGSEIDTLLPEAQQALKAELEQRKIQPKNIESYVVETAWKELTGKVKLPDIPRQQLKAELQMGTRIIVFQYCYSIIIFSFKRTSPAFLIKFGESPWNRGVKYSLISFFFGWWGIPWGPIWTISTLYRNLKGGIDMTGNVRRVLNQIND
jgi:hypothetical protein